MLYYFMFILLLLYPDVIQSSPNLKETIKNPDPVLARLPDEIVKKHQYIGGLVDISSNSTQGRAFCASTLIGPNEVITAAHCFFNKTQEDFWKNRVVSRNCGRKYIGCTKVIISQSFIDGQDLDYGIDDQAEKEQCPDHEVNVVDVYIHEAYYNRHGKFFVHDLAILKLETQVFNCTPSPLPDKSYNVSKDGNILGWGKTSNNSTLTSADLKIGNITVLNNTMCQQKLDDLNVSNIKLSPGNICSYGVTKNGSSPCSGDSGGPMICQPNNVLCGVLSGSYDCSPDIPSIYNSLAYYDDWISTTKESIERFRRTRVSSEIWKFEVHFVGRQCAPMDFFSEIKLNDEFANQFITALAQVPLQSFVFEMNVLTETVCKFQVIKAEVYQCSTADEELRVEGNAVIPCISGENWHSFNMAHFIREGDKQQLRQVIQEVAIEVERNAIEENKHVRKVTTSIHDFVGIYFAIDAVDYLETVSLTLQNEHNAGGYGISAVICTDTACCTINFGDLSAGTTTTLESPIQFDTLYIDNQVKELTVSLESTARFNQFLPQSFTMKLNNGKKLPVMLFNKWIQYRSEKHRVIINGLPGGSRSLSRSNDMEFHTTKPIEVPADTLSFNSSIGGILLSPRRFLQNMLDETNVTHARDFVTFLRNKSNVPYEDFTLTFSKVHKATWHSTPKEHEYMFKVDRQKVLYPDCNPQTQSFKTDKLLVIPCIGNERSHEWKSLNFASFLRKENETKVISMVRKMAEEILDQAGLGGREITGTSTYNNVPGVYLAYKESYDNVVLVIGGYDLDARNCTDANDAIIVNENTLKPLADFPIKTMFAVGGILDGQPVICGGKGINSDVYYTDCYKFDGIRWNRFAQMKEARAEASAIVTSKGLWITGGRSTSGFLNTTELITINENGSNEALSRLPEPMIGHCTVQSEDKIFIIGGASENEPKDTTLLYNLLDLSYATHTQGPSLNWARHHHGCCLARSSNHGNRNVIMILGGLPEDSTKNMPMELLDYSIPGQSWQQMKVKDLPRRTWIRPGLHPHSDGDGVVVIDPKDIFKIVNNETHVSKVPLDVTLRHPRDAFVSLTLPQSLLDLR